MHFSICQVTKKLEDFGRVSLKRGFTGQSGGKDDTKPGAVITYMWQWTHIKV